MHRIRRSPSQGQLGHPAQHLGHFASISRHLGQYRALHQSRKAAHVKGSSVPQNKPNLAKIDLSFRVVYLSTRQLRREKRVARWNSKISN